MLWLETNTIPRLDAYGRTLIGYENYHNALWLATKVIRRLGLHERESKRATDGLTYKDDSISGYASSRQVATKIKSLMIQFESLCQTLKLWTKKCSCCLYYTDNYSWIKLNLGGFFSIFDASHWWRHQYSLQFSFIHFWSVRSHIALLRNTHKRQYSLISPVLAHLKIQMLVCMFHQRTVWSNMFIEEKLFKIISPVYILKIYTKDILLSQFVGTFEIKFMPCIFSRHSLDTRSISIPISQYKQEFTWLMPVLRLHSSTSVISLVAVTWRKTKESLSLDHPLGVVSCDRPPWSSISSSVTSW